MSINTVDLPTVGQGSDIQNQGETRQIRGANVAPVSPKVEDATRRIQNGQASPADYQLVKQAALNTRTVNNNLRSGQ